jgi:hypothetical protein
MNTKNNLNDSKFQNHQKEEDLNSPYTPPGVISIMSGFQELSYLMKREV